MAYNLILCTAILNVIIAYLGREQPFHRWLAPTLKELKHRKNALGPEKPSHRKTYLEW